SPSLTMVLAGCLVIAGALCTVSVAASVVAVPATFLNVARNSLPFSEVFVLAIVNLAAVAPAMLLHVVPPLVDFCHCTVAAGNASAAASKLALWPSSTVVLAGCWVTEGAFRTVRVAALLVASGETPFLNTARNWFPLSDRFVLAIVSWLEVAPSIGLHVL